MMTRSIVLRDKVKKNGLKYTFLAKELNLSNYGLAKKIDNKSRFYADEIQKLCVLLNIESLEEKEYIFFANNVE